MPTISKRTLSGSINGRGIKVVATVIGTGTTIHDAVTGTVDTDLITLFVYNSDTAQRTLTLGWGGTTSPDDLIVVNVPSQTGLALVVADLPLRNALGVKAAGSVANVLVIHGYVNRITV